MNKLSTLLAGTALTLGMASTGCGLLRYHPTIERTIVYQPTPSISSQQMDALVTDAIRRLKRQGGEQEPKTDGAVPALYTPADERTSRRETTEEYAARTGRTQATNIGSTGGVSYNGLRTIGVSDEKARDLLFRLSIIHGAEGSR